jgi:hypothetical protein
MRYVGIDTETFLITPGNVAPRLVCLSIAEYGRDSRLLNAADAKLAFYSLITDPKISLVGHNIAFDLLVLAKTWGYLDEVFAAYEAKRIRDTGIRQRLIDIANGRTKEGLVCRNGVWAKASYKLLDLEKLHLTPTSPDAFDLREAVKNGPDAWRLRYSELVDVPIAQWPEAASK